MPRVVTPERVFRLLAARLRAIDPTVRDAVLIGSAVYAPDLARDYNLVVTTAAPRECDEELRSALWDALNESADRTVDLVLRHAGEEISGLALGVLAGRIVLGAGETVSEARRCYEEAGGMAHWFAEADSCLRAADELWARAGLQESGDDRLRLRMIAFDQLFHAARIAALTHLAREDDRWGGVDKALLAPYGRDFKRMLTTLHLLYGYEGKLPEGQEDEEYRSWRRRVEDFVAHFRQLAQTGADPRP